MTIKSGMTRYTDKEVVADFVFKNQNSRTDVLVRDDSGALSRFYCDAVSDKASIRVYRGAAMIQQADLHERSIGYDFSPAVFIDVTGYPVMKHLEATLHVPETRRSVELDDKGILHYMTSAAERMPSGKPRAVTKIGFDTEKGFLPIYYEAIHNRPDGTWSAQTIRLEWVQYNDVWYVSRVERDSLPSHKTRFTFVVESFTPNAEVSDKEFTLEGLGIPEGLRVEDSIAGITYPYRSSGKPEFVRKIIKRRVDSSGTHVDSNQRPAPANADQRADGPTDVSVVGQTSARATWTRWVGLIAAVMLIGAVGFIGIWGRGVRRRGWHGV